MISTLCETLRNICQNESSGRALAREPARGRLARGGKYPADQLILSKFAGAAEDMREAVLVNPYDSDATANALHGALHMELGERRWRHQRLLARLHRADAAGWGHDCLAAPTSAVPAHRHRTRPQIVGRHQ